MDRAGLRRKLLKAQAEAGDIVLLFGDQFEALPHPSLAHAWAKGADLRIPAPGQAAKVAMLGLLDWAPRELIVRTSRSKCSADFIALLEQIDTQYGSSPDRATKPIVLVLDNGPIHTSKATRAALAERASWLTVEWLPKYAPELNDIEELSAPIRSSTSSSLTKLSRVQRTSMMPSTRRSRCSIASEVADPSGQPPVSAA